MLSKSPELSIIIPAFKEAQKISNDIQAAAAFLQNHSLAGEIIVVDDGSGDETAAVAEQLKSVHPNLQVLAYSQNRGKGHALRYGIVRSQGKYVMFADAGLCVPYEIATIGMTMIRLGMCDLAHGSRRMRGSIRRRQPLYRRLGSKVYGFVVHTCLGIPWSISDTQCGFKIYSGDVARSLYSLARTDGFMIDIEVILLALRQGYHILEFPVLWYNDHDTRYDPIKGTWRNFRELLAIRFRQHSKVKV